MVTYTKELSVTIKSDQDFYGPETLLEIINKGMEGLPEYQEIFEITDVDLISEEEEEE